MADDLKNQHNIPTGIPVASVTTEKDQQFGQPQYAQYAMQQPHPGMPPQQAFQMPPGQPMMHYVQSMPMQDGTSMGMQNSGIPGGGRFCPHGQHVFGPSKPTMLAWVICMSGLLVLIPFICSLFMCKERQCQVCGYKEEQTC